MKTILITGAESGIGRDTAIALARRGHHILATTRTDTAVSALQEYATKQGVSLDVSKLDITSEADREKVAAHTLDVLINVAGTGDSGPLSEIPLERLREVFEVNVFGTLSLSQIALAGMIERKKGTVLIVSSVAGRLPIPFLAPYGMTKFALSAGAAAMRDEVHVVAPNVHVSLIEPGAYHTGFNQYVFGKKYEWIKESSPFHKIIPKLRQEDTRFSYIEQKNTASIVRQIVRAAEAMCPSLRYIAPWYQGVGVQLARIIGR